MPLNLCLHVQGMETLTPQRRQDILDASSGFITRDIFFTEGNQGAAGPRAELLKRSAKTPFVFTTDNDMVFQPGSLDALFAFMTDEKNASYGMIDLVHNYLRWHRRIEGTKVICDPVNFSTKIVDVDLIGAASILMRQEVAMIPEVIDPRYIIGTWDFDMCLNIKKAGWKIATLCDESLIAINDKTYRTPTYMKGKVHNPIRLKGLKLFEKKWGFSSEYYPETPKQVESPVPMFRLGQIPPDATSVITRAIYAKLGNEVGPGILSPTRLRHMQSLFIRSLANQTDKDFTLYIMVGDESNETTKAIESLDWEDLNVKFLYTISDTSPWKKSIKESKNWGREHDEGCPEDIARKFGHPMSTIMARLDNDDWVAPGWIAHMKHMALTKHEENFLINYQVISQGPDGRLYRFFAPHNPKRVSPFLAVVQKKDPKITPYADIHLNMGKFFDVTYTIPPAYTFMVIHGENRSNRIYEDDVALDGVRYCAFTQVKKPKVKKQKPKQIPKDSWRSRIIESDCYKINQSPVIH